MKKSLTILLCLSMPFFIMAQETNKQREIGLVFNNPDNFGLTFKTGSDKSLWRFNTLSISGNSSNLLTDSSDIKQNNMGIGITFGKEFRKNVILSFVDSILDDEKKPIVPKQDVFNVMSVCFAAEQAMQNNTTVKISYT